MVLKLKARVGLIFAAALTTLFLVLIVTTGAYQIARQDNVTITETHVPSIEASRRMIELAQDAFFGQVIYIDDPAYRAHSQPFRAQHISEWWQAYQVARASTTSPDERALLDRMAPKFNSFLAAGERLRAAVDAGRIAEARRIHKDESRPAFETLRADIVSLRDLNRAQIFALTADAYERFDQAEAIAIGIAALGTLVAGLLWWRASRDIVRPLRSLTEATAAMGAGRFVLSTDPHAASTVELAALQAGFNRMSRQLAEVGAQLREANASLESQVAERTRELRQANARLEHLVAELQTLDQLKSDFLAVMSHELLTPINFITGFGSALEDELFGPLNAKQLETVKKMMAGADRLTRMVRNTLVYTQLQAGTLELGIEAPVDYAALLAAVAEEVEIELTPRRQTLVLVLPPAVPPVKVDPHRTRQVLLELLNNAAKFSPEGAHLRLTVTAEPDDVVTELADPGTGIPDEALPKLFLPFYQADSSRTRAHGGMGLGLAIAYQLVVRMGGTMLVSSALGQGTTIRFSLPRAAPAPRPNGATDSSARRQASG
jgi:signal transduction histidine kinase